MSNIAKIREKIDNLSKEIIELLKDHVKKSPSKIKIDIRDSFFTLPTFNGTYSKVSFLILVGESLYIAVDCLGDFYNYELAETFSLDTLAALLELVEKKNLAV